MNNILCSDKTLVHDYKPEKIKSSISRKYDAINSYESSKIVFDEIERIILYCSKCGHIKRE